MPGVTRGCFGECRVVPRMSDAYHLFESILLWGTVMVATGLVVYLGYLQLLKAKHRRARRRHRARRALRRAARQAQPPDTSPGAVQEPTSL